MYTQDIKTLYKYC